MSATSTTSSTGEPATRESRRWARGARERVLEAALELFGEHGVSGTSLQMIADRIGVTKAAVYHQFKTKEEIVAGVLDPALDSLRESVEAAERQETPVARRDAMLAAVVDLAVSHRHLAAILHADPAAGEMVRTRTNLDLGPRVRALMVGPDPDVRADVAGSMVGGALMMAGVAPELQQYGDEELAKHLLELARDVLDRHAGASAARRQPER
jgi:AcrR family transcriptional regulator